MNSNAILDALCVYIILHPFKEFWEVSPIKILIFQMKEVRHQGFPSLPVVKWQSQNLNPHSLALEAAFTNWYLPSYIAIQDGLTCSQLPYSTKTNLCNLNAQYAALWLENSTNFLTSRVTNFTRLYRTYLVWRLSEFFFLCWKAFIDSLFTVLL